jgi:hypothetical protein
MVFGGTLSHVVKHTLSQKNMNKRTVTKNKERQRWYKKGNADLH